jgi:putative endonuclease
MSSRSRAVSASQWKDARHRRGLWGERVAMSYLVGRGWTIEAHRFRLGHQEVDLVARRGELVAFVEVKTRTSESRGAPAESVVWQKRRTIARVAEVWRERYGRAGDAFRFDVVEVRVGAAAGCGAGKYRIQHLEDAWRLDQ